MINCLLCPLAVNAKVIMEPKFDAKRVWDIFLDADEESHNDDVSVFMAVPTIYAKLIQEYHKMEAEKQQMVKQKIMSKIRLMVSGSAHLPDVSIFYSDDIVCRIKYQYNKSLNDDATK